MDDLQNVSEQDIVEDLPELLFEAAPEEILLLEPAALEEKLSENSDISNEELTNSGENSIDNIPEIINVKPGPKLETVEKHEANDIICIGPVDAQEDTEALLSNITAAESTNIVVDCCMLCGFAPRHQYVLWEHYLRHHFR